MRIELFYTPGCNSYKKALDILQTVIAEERLPLHVEVISAPGRLQTPCESPVICINGDRILPEELSAQGAFCRLYPSQQGLLPIPGVEQIRDILWRKWNELTASS
jgi:hypothetical protein